MSHSLSHPNSTKIFSYLCYKFFLPSYSSSLLPIDNLLPPPSSIFLLSLYFHIQLRSIPSPSSLFPPSLTPLLPQTFPTSIAQFPLHRLLVPPSSLIILSPSPPLYHTPLSLHANLHPPPPSLPLSPTAVGDILSCSFSLRLPSSFPVLTSFHAVVISKYDPPRFVVLFFCTRYFP